MTNNPLLEELNIVQSDYLFLLKELDKIPLDDISLNMIDWINVFWYENRNIVKLLFEYLYRGKDTYCFSAATIFDVDDTEQNSFFLLGEYHVFDDPIPSYLNTLKGISDEVYLTKMKEIISKTIKDNIRIIEELGDDLLILPLRYSSVVINQHYENLDEIAVKLFCNLFTEIQDVNEYKEKVVTLDDLVQHLDTHYSASILLYDGDNPTEAWEYRMQKYKEENDNFDMKTLSYGGIFFLAVFGNIRQALALIDMSNTFGVIPFIRSFIPLHYYVFLSSILEYDLNQVECSILKTKVSYFLYQEYRKRGIKYSLEELKQKAENIDFETKLFADLRYSGDEVEINRIIYVINQHLDGIENS